MKNDILSIAALTLMVSAGSLYAASEPGTARVFVQETNSIAENTKANFGGIARTDDTCSMNDSGVLSDFCCGTGATACFGITSSLTLYGEIIDPKTLSYTLIVNND